MTGREKIEAGLGEAGAREFGVVICYEGIYYRDHWDALTECPWWYARSNDIEHQLAWRSDCIAATPQDWLELREAAPRAEREATRIEVRGDGAWRVDARTGESERLAQPTVGGWAASGAAASVHPAEIARKNEEIERAVPLDPDFDERKFSEEGRGDLAAAMLARFPDLYPLGGVNSPLWCTHSLWGFEEMMAISALDPGLVEHACERYLHNEIQHVRQAAAMGARGVWIEECLTDYFSPAAFARLNVPFLRRLVDEIRRCGMKSIYYYCGNPADRWDLLFEVGADAISLEEGKKGWKIDVDEVVKRAGGRCAVLGNLDAIRLLERGGEDELRAEIARQISAGRANGARFVMSIGSPVTPGTPPERVRLYCEIARELGSLHGAKDAR